MKERAHISNMGGSGRDSEDEIAFETGITTREKLKEPDLYRVVLLNDDFTPMDFVVLVLQKFFNKKLEEATRIMYEVHNQGAGTAGVFSHEVAESKTYQVNVFARQNEHPLKCIFEKEPSRAQS